MQNKPRIALVILMEAETETNPIMRPNTRPCVFPQWESHILTWADCDDLILPSTTRKLLVRSQNSAAKNLHNFWFHLQFKALFKKVYFYRSQKIQK